jgi:hypothetical protein
VAAIVEHQATVRVQRIEKVGPEPDHEPYDPCN